MPTEITVPTVAEVTAIAADVEILKQKLADLTSLLAVLGQQYTDLETLIASLPANTELPEEVKAAATILLNWLHGVLTT